MTLGNQEMRAESVIAKLLEMKEQMLTNRSVMDALVHEGNVQVEGCYLKGKLNGVVTMLFDNGTMEFYCEDNIASDTVHVEMGSFRFVGRLPEGPGTMTTIEGLRYVGMMKNFVPHGFGSMYNPNGTWERGEWCYGELQGETTTSEVNSGIIH